MPEISGLNLSIKNLDLLNLLKISQYISQKFKFSEELSLIVIACENNNLCGTIANFISASISASGNHSAMLGKINKTIYFFAIKFINADCGLYISNNKSNVILNLHDSKGLVIPNFAKEVKDFCPTNNFKQGLNSNYADIIGRLIKE